MRTLFVLALLLSCAACAPPSYDLSSLEGRAAILARTRGYLDNRDCTAAISSIEGLYNSESTNNEVRLLRASAHGCNAGLENFLQFLADLITKDLVGGALWASLCELFHYDDADQTGRRIASSWFAIDSLQASIREGTVILPIDRVSVDDWNLASLVASDRTSDSNSYLMFITMASIGNMETHYGDPDPTTFRQGQALGATAANPQGWSVATAVNSSSDEAACAYAAGVLNMLDAIHAASSTMPTAVASTLSQIETTFSTAIGEACEAGCIGSGGGPVTVSGYAMTPNSGCAIAAGECQTQNGRPCPRKLRDRRSCLGLITDKNSCAAAGLIQVINEHPILGWQGP